MTPRRQPRPAARPRGPAAAPTARAAALEVIRRVTEGDAYSNLTLRSVLERARLPARDAALATELAYGTLRRLVSLDRSLGRLVDRPLASTPNQALAALRLGAYQLLHTRIPAHAAVAETVALAPERQRGFVNAVLRRLATEAPSAPSGPGDAAVALRTGLAEWGVRELRRLLPEDEVEVAASALAERAPVTLRVNTCRAGPDEVERRLAEAGVATERGRIHPASLLLSGGGAPVELPGFAEGRFAVQDQASAFVVSVLDPRPGERVLDVCAAPGGKAGHAACLVEPGGIVVAADVSEGRLRLVRSTAERLGVRGLLVVQDGRRPAVREGFDRVLVDAPCSGIGSARRRPELLWRARKADVAVLSRLQVGIATAAADLVRDGGRLIYSVCTFPRAETDSVCDALLRRRPDLQPEAIEGPDGPAERIRLWPHRHGCDAMFVAAFRRPATDLRRPDPGHR
ncbi:MAG TPA: 16S rRNA (cytosine(967)-C(5))-methyltransferase RsmB [Actinomycetota bacterium]|nr:16S rRNA (cytosine(967)-C(5))-methyltransferase RsmB [Actinomycetota bacterium]